MEPDVSMEPVASIFERLMSMKNDEELTNLYQTRVLGLYNRQFLKNSVFFLLLKYALLQENRVGAAQNRDKLYVSRQARIETPVCHSVETRCRRY